MSNPQTQNKPTQTQTAPAPATDFERLINKQTKEMTYVPFGGQDNIKLSIKTVQDLICVKTKTGKTCTENDAIKFMMMCQAQRLNPFAGDAYMLGYDTQDGPKFSLITAHQAFLKRAEVHPEYDGMESGVILVDDNNTITEREGDFHLVDEQVVGGWAKVYCKGRRIPTYRRIRLSRFVKGFGVWKDDAAGMIVKCAEADSLRSTFPTMVGGLYLREELDFMPDAPVQMSRPMFETPLAKAMSRTEAPETMPAPESVAPQADAQETASAVIEEPKAVGPQGNAYNPLKALRSLLKIAKIKDSELLDFWAVTGASDGSQASLEEVQMSMPGLITATAEKWGEFSAQLLAQRRKVGGE